MNKHRVYLSKSKAGNFNDIVKVRNYCKLLGLDLLEFSGGEYTDYNLLSSDCLLVLPPELGAQPTVGKGQTTEIQTFLKERSCSDIFIISNLSNRLHIDEFLDISLTENNWQTDYAKITTNGAEIDIINYDIVNPRLISDEYFEEEIVGSSKTKPMLACLTLFK